MVELVEEAHLRYTSEHEAGWPPCSGAPHRRLWGGRAAAIESSICSSTRQFISAAQSDACALRVAGELASADSAAAIDPFSEPVRGALATGIDSLLSLFLSDVALALCLRRTFVRVD